MIRQNELMNVRCSERGSLLGIKIYSPSSECLSVCGYSRTISDN